MKKLINNFFVFVFLLLLVGCAKSNTGIRYVFVDETGKEHNGWCELAPNTGRVQLPQVLLHHSGVLTIYNSNGHKWIEGEYDHAKPDGYIKMWAHDGHLFVEDNYKNGLRHGKSIWRHTNEVKEMEVDYINGERDGLWIEWDEDGNETSRRLFKNNKLIK